MRVYKKHINKCSVFVICNHVTVVTRKKTSYRRKFESV
nr:MAG TPA: hypothetical protein [Caudoviricetes sp.]